MSLRWLPVLLLLACPAAKPTLDQAALRDPASCEGCHPQHVEAWRRSAHAHATSDPVFVAMNRRGQRETDGGLGSFCVNCHAPLAVRDGLTVDGLNLEQVPQPLQGVGCYFCHSVTAVTGVHDNPLTLATDGVLRGPIADPVSNVAHASAASPFVDRTKLESASLCGACHDVVTPHGVALERTFAEWRATVFSRAAGGSTCGTCHQPQSLTPQAVANQPGLPLRRTHAHDFPAVDVNLLSVDDTERAGVQAALDGVLQTALCVAPDGRVQAVLDNVAAGHSFPSGAGQDRRLQVEVSAFVDGGLVFDSRATPDGGDAWVLRDCLTDATGQPVHMFWEATRTEGFSLAAPLLDGTPSPHVGRWYQPSGVPDRVVLTVWLEPVGHEVLEDLVASGDLDAGWLQQVPRFQLGAALEWTPQRAHDTYVEDRTQALMHCVSDTALDVTVPITPATPATCR